MTTATAANSTAEVVECSHEEYHSDGANSVSRSELDAFLENEEEYHAKYILRDWEDKRSQALDLGTVFHEIVLGTPWEIDADNYSHKTLGIFDRCGVPARTPDRISASTSRYWFQNDGVIRQSGHWGRVGDCYWAHPQPDGERTGFCRFDRMLFDDGHFVPIPDDVLSANGSKAGGKWKAFEEEHAGQILLKDKEWGPMVEWWQAMVSHSRVNNILFRSGGQNEFTIRWQDEETGLQLRCRLDRYIDGVLIGDAKTARTVDPVLFAKDAYTHGYHRQSAFYQMGVEALTGLRVPMVYLAAEKKTRNPNCVTTGIPYGIPRCEAIELDEEFVDMGRWEVRQGLRRLAECRETGVWRSPSYGKIVTVSAPSYAVSRFRSLSS